MIWRILFGAAVGAVIGFGWHRFVGCSTGACPLTRNPVVSTLYGMFTGALISATFH